MRQEEKKIFHFDDELTFDLKEDEVVQEVIKIKIKAQFDTILDPYDHKARIAHHKLLAAQLLAAFNLIGERMREDDKYLNMEVKMDGTTDLHVLTGASDE